MPNLDIYLENLNSVTIPVNFSAHGGFDANVDLSLAVHRARHVSQACREICHARIVPVFTHGGTSVFVAYSRACSRQWLNDSVKKAIKPRFNYALMQSAMCSLKKS